jgi:hypothetical protein
MTQYELPYIPHQIEGEIVTLRQRDGYINATAMCSAAGKKFNDYTRIGPTRAFLEELATETGLPATELIQTLTGGTPHLQGSGFIPKSPLTSRNGVRPNLRSAYRSGSTTGFQAERSGAAGCHITSDDTSQTNRMCRPDISRCLPR